MPQVILVTGSSVRPDLLKPLEDAGYEVRSTEETETAKLRGQLDDAVGYLFGGDEFITADLLDGADELRLISFLGVGWDGFMNVEDVRAHGIAVTNTPGTLSASVAELTIGLLLDAVRQISFHVDAFFGGHEGVKTREASSLRIGIIGLGSIGSTIARSLRLGFDSDVSYYSRTQKPSLEQELGLTYRPLLELAAWSEALIVMPAGNDSTRGLVDETVIQAMPDGAVLVNTSKPFVVTSSALLEGLRSGKLRTAAFDGFYDHADPNYDVLVKFGRDRLLVTPHLGSLTSEARDRMGALAVKNLTDYLSTGSAEFVVLDGSRTP
jgi:lactate dehydrogenase-like 2-hydroxyacid dehydrogenase